ncbi:MAG: hypothetical protein ACFFCS_21710 [Candidatus Hodarchaeota archaeon]
MDIYDDNYSELFHVINSLSNVKIIINHDAPLAEELLLTTDILILGCPSNKEIKKLEIDVILKYVRDGGNLLVISDAGGDSANETNLNDLVANFHIKIEPTMIRDQQLNMGSSVAPVIDNINVSHPAMKNVLKVAFGGCATLKIDEPATSLIATNNTCLIERFTPGNEEAWTLLRVGENWPIIASTPYGQGKVVVCGDIDIFSNDEDYGIRAMDNKVLIKNIITWFLTPMDVSSVIDWLVSRITNLEEKVENLQQNQNILIKENQELKREVRKYADSEDRFPFIEDEDE